MRRTLAFLIVLLCAAPAHAAPRPLAADPKRAALLPVALRTDDGDRSPASFSQVLAVRD